MRKLRNRLLKFFSRSNPTWLHGQGSSSRGYHSWVPLALPLSSSYHLEPLEYRLTWSPLGAILPWVRPCNIIGLPPSPPWLPWLLIQSRNTSKGDRSRWLLLSNSASAFWEWHCRLRGNWPLKNRLPWWSTCYPSQQWLVSWWSQEEVTYHMWNQPRVFGLA